MNDHTHKHTHGKRDAVSSVEHPVATDAAAAIDGTPGLAGSAVTYTCPMHPEVRQDHPGNCPKCGMTLEPIIPLDEEDNSEL